MTIFFTTAARRTRRAAVLAVALLAAVASAMVFAAPQASADASGQTFFKGGSLRIDVTGVGDQIYMVKGSFTSVGTALWHINVDLWNTNGGDYDRITGPMHYTNNGTGSFTWSPNSFPAWSGKACVSLYSNQDRKATACINILPSTTSVQTRYNLRCLDADLNTIGGNGAKVQLWDCNRQAQQLWVLDSNGALRSVRGGRCLDADLNTIGGNGTKVQLWDCNGQPQQVWILTPGGAIRNVRSGRCLDADLNTIGGNGTKVQLWDCNGQPQQNWG